MTDIIQEPTIWQTLVQLFGLVLLLVKQLAGLGFHWALWLIFGAVCLWGINWKRTQHFLVSGAWAPAVLLIVLIALVWSRIDPRPCSVFGLPNFWWQLGYVALLACFALFLGWVQGVMHWNPGDVHFEPPAHGHGHGHDSHGHGHDTSHGHGHDSHGHGHDASHGHDSHGHH